MICQPEGGILREGILRSSGTPDSPKVALSGGENRSGIDFPRKSLDLQVNQMPLMGTWALTRRFGVPLDLATATVA
jgi:hypothetical protein